MNLDSLIREVCQDDVVQSREALETWIPELHKHLPRLWQAVFDRCTTRVNKYLFLNGPELWANMSAAEWFSIMSGGITRSYRAPDVFDTGRFDDTRLLHRYVGVDAMQMFFRGANPSIADREAVARYALRFPESFLPDEWDEELFENREVHVTRAMLGTYRDALRGEVPWLELAAADADSLLARVKRYAGDSGIR